MTPVRNTLYVVRRLLWVALAVALVIFAGVVSAAAQPAGEAANETTHTVTATIDGYDVDFTLPTAAKAGCMVCHGDPNLIRLREDRLVSYYVDGEELEAGPHASVQCSACHLDFAFVAPHESEDWQRTAALSCKNCHQDQFNAYGAGAHREVLGEGGTPDPAAADKPLCGDCHGGHSILTLTDAPENRRLLHADGWEMCGRCHEDYWDSYNDYYHGAAYKRGAYDAPSCWECHGWHDILPADDRRSAVHPSRLIDTCGACHPDVNDEYVAYAEFIHGRADIVAANPVHRILRSIRGFFSGLFGA